MTLTRKQIPSPNYSSRGGAKVRLIVLHTAEGALTIEALGNFFASPASQVSSHVGIDDKPGTIGEYVKRENKAWTSANANPVAVQAELCAFASWSTSEWNKHPNMLSNCANWIAEEAKKYGIPITKLTPAQAQGTGIGVCQHVDLGSWGGGHHDCGSGFPYDDVLSMARGGAPSPSPEPPKPPATAAPPFPYPPDHYLGQPSADPKCHSGYYGAPDTTNVRTWQGRMQQRGWSLSVDGKYGPQSQSVCKTFQSEKGLAVDGLVGPQTWKAAWTVPVT
jgi:hypothetical protein